MKESGKHFFRILAAVVLILLALVFTIKFIKMLPAFTKIIAIGANIATIYFAIDWVKRKRNKNKNK